MRGVSDDASVAITIKKKVTIRDHLPQVSSMLGFASCVFYSIPECRYQRGIIKVSRVVSEIPSRSFDDALTNRIKRLMS